MGTLDGVAALEYMSAAPLKGDTVDHTTWPSRSPVSRGDPGANTCPHNDPHTVFVAAGSVAQMHKCPVSAGAAETHTPQNVVQEDRGAR